MIAPLWLFGSLRRLTLSLVTKAVRCVVPAPQGEIAVRIENGEIAYHLPAGIEGELVLKDRTLSVSGDGCEKL